VTRRVSLAFLLCFVSSLARAQDAAVGSSFSQTHLRELPASDNVFSLLEVSEGEVISDRFYGGGLNTGQPARDGAFLNPWTQTQFFVGDVNVTMPNGGVPFLFPTVAPWDRMDVGSALQPAGVNAPGLAVSFQPARPAATWTRVIDASGAGSGLVANPSTDVAPPIYALRTATHVGVFVSGPVSPRVGLMANVEWAGAAQADRTGVPQVDGRARSVFAHLVMTPNASNEVRTVGWIQRTEVPFASATAAGLPLADQTTFTHIQSTWDRHPTDAMTWRLFGAYSQADASRSGSFPSAFAIERMLVGPVPLLADSGNRTDRRWSAGARLASTHGRQTWLAGVDAGRASARIGPGYVGAIAEADDGKPARVWQYTNNGRDAERQATTLTAFVSDHVGLGPGRSLEVGVGYDGVNGSADGAAVGISWHSVLPRVSLRWKQSEASHFTWIAGYSRSADRLTLDTLAVGDPAAPYAAVSRWTAAGVGPVVARVGPGTGGGSDFSAIDASLHRPLTDEIVAGIDAQLTPNIRGRITGVAKQVTNLFDLVDIGAPASSYSISTVVDGRPEADGGDVLLPVYNRLPATFGADRYLLTNRTSEDTATAAALVLNSDVSLKRLTLMFNASASITDGPAASRGFHTDENNLGSLGELSIDPNAATSARGRLFYDRAFTMKISAVYRFPHDVTLGVIARYQDGQPFSRVTVVPNLNQGTELVRAYPAGDARFMYTGTLDMRLQKRMTMGATALAVFVDAYNLVNMGNEVEERVVTGSPAFRDITAIQPPFAAHIGLRFQF
jgi:hypothetical protein